MTDFKDSMIEAVERGQTTEHDAYDFVRETLADVIDRARKAYKETPPPVRISRSRLLTLSFGEDNTMSAGDAAAFWAYWHERGLRELRYRAAFPDEIPPEVSLAEMIPARDAGDVCGICGEQVTWLDHLPARRAGGPVRCFSKVRELRPLKVGERLIDGEIVYSSGYLDA